MRRRFGYTMYIPWTSMLLIGVLAPLLALDATTAQPRTLLAEPSSTLRHSYGLKVGGVLSGYEGDDYRPYLGYEIEWLQDDAGSPHLGFQFGVFYAYHITPRLSVQPELFVAQRGLHFYKKRLYNTAYHLRAYYLQVPVLLRYRALMVGPYAALNIRADRTLEVWGERDTQRLDCIRRMDYGLTFAVSPSFPAGRGRWIAEVRLDWGLAHAMVTPTDYTEFFDPPSPSRLLAFSILTGYRF